MKLDAPPFPIVIEWIMIELAKLFSKYLQILYNLA